MDKCDWCGEYAKVRKIKYYGFGGSHLFSMIAPMTFSYDLVCEKCCNAKYLMIKKEEEEKKIIEAKLQKEWIKKRDKFLGEK